MRNFYLRLCGTLMVILPISVVVAEPTTIKCHVEVIGGGQSIHTITFPSNRPVNIHAVKESLVGTKIYYGISKLAIYKVKECLIATEKFKSKVALTLEKNSDI